MGDESVGSAESGPEQVTPVPPPPPYYPPVPPPPPGHRPEVFDAVPRAPRSRKGLYLSLAVAGWLVVAVGTATAVVAVGSNNNDTTTTVADAVPSATASATPSAAPTTAAPVPTAAPSPTSTVRGSVSGSTHRGDLRFFLLPVPADAAAYGDQDGTKMTVAQLAKLLGNPTTSKKILDEYGCSGGATRTYRTNDGTYTVETQLMHFSSSGYASDWVQGLSFGSHAKSFGVSGVSGARGFAIDPSDPDGDGEVFGIAHEGDVEYEITVTGTGKLPHSVLNPLMQREAKRLKSGH
ncbi:hypothetical protein [Streptacidiphilus sp. PAMC 29251]